MRIEITPMNPSRARCFRYVLLIVPLEWSSVNIILLLENPLQPHLDELAACYRIASERSAGRDVDGLLVIGQGDRSWLLEGGGVGPAG